MPNTLYYGDNLEILRQHVAAESVDLVYLDPPFNSNASYNVLFRERSGEESPAQIQAFTDTWEWTQETERTYELDIIQNPAVPATVKDMISAFRQFIGRNAMMAYLVMMAPRLVEMHRVLSPTGSIYLHCDPTASHYLKLLMDAVFGSRLFKNEIVWPRTNAHHDARRYGRIHDSLLYYGKSLNATWNTVYTPYTSRQTDAHYSHIEKESGRRFRLSDLSAQKPGGDVEYEWKGVAPPRGRYWAYSRDNMEEFERSGRLYYTRNGHPFLKRYLDEMPGNPAQDIWSDVPFIHGSSMELLGFKTQKPEALLERIIQASSNEGDVVLDPFCGCGTAVAAAQKLGRQWLGIDITHLAVALMKNRLKTGFGLEPGRDYRVVGEPVDSGSARALWEQDPYQFQFWAVSLLEAQPQSEQRRGADRGIDGLLYFIDGPRRTSHKIVVQVKGGRVSSPQVRDLKGVVEREQAALGLFISLDEPTRDMRTEAASGGLYHSDIWQKDYPKIQIRTIAELLEGKGFEIPPHPPALQAAPRVRRAEGRQSTLGEAG